MFLKEYEENVRTWQSNSTRKVKHLCVKMIKMRNKTHQVFWWPCYKVVKPFKKRNCDPMHFWSQLLYYSLTNQNNLTDILWDSHCLNSNSQYRSHFVIFYFQQNYSEYLCQSESNKKDDQNKGDFFSSKSMVDKPSDMQVTDIFAWEICKLEHWVTSITIYIQPTCFIHRLPIYFLYVVG